MRSSSLCALLWRLLSWCHPRGIVLQARHIPGHLNVIADKLSRHNKVIQSGPFLNRRSIFVLEMGPTTCRPVCNPVQPQPSQVCFTGTGSSSLGSGRHESVMGEFERLYLPSNLLAQPSNLTGDGSRLLQDDPDCSGMAQHALVLGPSHSVNSGFLQTSATKGSCATALQRGSTQESQQSKSACLAPRASVIQELDSLMKWQQELRLLREAQPEPFTNQSGPFLSDSANQTRWTSGRPL